MTRDDCDTASRLIAKFLQFTLPGQIELPLDWVNDLEESEEVAPFSDDKSYVDKQIKKNGVEFFSSPKNKVKHEKLEDGELLEEDENKNNAGKEDDQKASSPNTSFDSLDACYNGSENGVNQVSYLKSANKLQTKRQKHSICKFFREGKCREGDSCIYSHKAADSHRTPQLCKEYIIGKCRKALKCNFLHGEHPCKDFLFGSCNALKCRFSHQPLDEYTRAVFEKTLIDAEEIAASAAHVTPPPPFSSSSYIPTFSPPTFPPQPFSKSVNSIMRTNPNSLFYNKNTFRKSTAPYNKKSSKSQPISAVPLQTVTVDCLRSDIAFSQPQLT